MEDKRAPPRKPFALCIKERLYFQYHLRKVNIRLLSAQIFKISSLILPTLLFKTAFKCLFLNLKEELQIILGSSNVFEKKKFRNGGETGHGKETSRD